MIYDFENLFNAYKAGIKCKRYRPDVMAYYVTHFQRPGGAARYI